MNTLDAKDLLIAFFKDYFIYEKTDMYGNRKSGYQFACGGSVGGFMSQAVFDYLLKYFGREALEQGALEIKEYNQQFYDNKILWNTMDEWAEKLNQKREEVALKIVRKYVRSIA